MIVLKVPETRRKIMIYLCDLHQIDDDLRKANGNRDQGCVEIYDLEKFLHGPEQEIIVIHGQPATSNRDELVTLVVILQKNGCGVAHVGETTIAIVEDVKALVVNHLDRLFPDLRPRLNKILEHVPAMKISQPVSVEPHPEDNRGNNGRDIFFDTYLASEINALAKKGIPVSIWKDSLCYRDDLEDVRFDSSITDLGDVNQWRANWVVDSFRIQIWVERIIKMVSVHDVTEIEQTLEGTLRWRWKERLFEAYCRREGLLGLWISDGQSQRDDQFELEGPLTPDFLLDKMHRIESALTVQIKLEIFLKKKGVTPECVLNGFDIGAVHIHVDLDKPISVDLNVHQSSLIPAPLKEVRAYVEEFKASRKSALQDEDPQEPMDSSTLDLA